MIYLKMTIPTKHQGIVALELIGINDTPSPDFRNSQSQHRFSADIRDSLDKHPAIPLQDTEYRDFSRSSSTSLAFTSTTEVGLINFHFAPKKCGNVLGMGHDSHTDRCNGIIHGIIRQSHLDGDLTCGEFQFKELDDSQPLSTGQVTAVDPPVGEIMEPVSAAETSSSSVCHDSELSGPTSAMTVNFRDRHLGQNLCWFFQQNPSTYLRALDSDFIKFS